MHPVHSLMKADLYKDLFACYLRALKENHIKRFQRKVISKFILENMESKDTEEAILDFLAILGKEYPIFKDMYTIYKNKIMMSREQNVIQTLQKHLIRA
jgi:predicted SnoaL-like aldol condensation-catalyzing enzyme